MERQEENKKQRFEKKNIKKLLEHLREKIRTDKRFKYVVLLLSILVLVGICILLEGNTVRGGQDTSALFSCKEKRNGSTVVTIDMKNYPKGIIETSVLDNSSLQTKNKGKSGNKQRYVLKTKVSTIEDWAVYIYRDEIAQKAQTPSWKMIMTVMSDDSGKLSVVSAVAEDMLAAEGTEDFLYAANVQDGNLILKVWKPLKIDWEIECEKKLSLYNTTETYDGAKELWIGCENEDSYETTVRIYGTTLLMNLEDNDSTEKNEQEDGISKTFELKLHLKVEKGKVVKVSYEQ